MKESSTENPNPQSGKTAVLKAAILGAVIFAGITVALIWRSSDKNYDFGSGSTIVEKIAPTEKIYLPFVVLGELRAGFKIGTRALPNEQNLIRFLNSTRVELLMADEQTTHYYASVFAQLKEQETPIPTNGIWIAMLVLRHNLLLLARDKHFNVLPQLARI